MGAMPPEYCLFWLSQWCMPRSDWAAWGQVLGSLAAVFAAIGLVWWQLRHERRRARDEEVRRLQILWTIVFHCRAEMAHVKEAMPKVQIVPRGLAHKVSALRSFPVLEVADASAAVAVLAVIEAHEFFDSRMRADQYGMSVEQVWQHYVPVALESLEFAERQLRRALLQRGADMPKNDGHMVYGHRYEPLEAS